MSNTFPENGRRVIFYLLHDRRGEVERYVLHKLRALRPFADHIFVVVNGSLTFAGRVALDEVADTVMQRKNVGFDVWGYKEAMEAFQDRLDDFDELILMNYTWYGPVRSFEPVFDRMNAAPLDFWGMTDHAGMTPNPFTHEGTMHSHMQSHWLAVRASMFQSDTWRDYWANRPPVTSYTDSILTHESVFTHHFSEAGFQYQVAFPQKNYSTLHPAFHSAEELLDDGCPVLKRRPFFHDPFYLDRCAVVGRWLAESAKKYGYPVDMIWEDVVRNTQPKILNTNASMLEILPDVPNQEAFDPDQPLSVAAVVHIFYEEMTDELLERLETIPVPFDLFITTTNEEKAQVIRGIIEARNSALISRSEVRVLPSNRGRDLSAFFIGARDVLLADYDLVVKIHSKKTAQHSTNIGKFFKKQQIDNLLNSPGYTANLFALFQKEPGLGMVFPPMIHMGFPTLGRGWFENYEPTEELCEQLGIKVPLDEVSPLAPMGAMFIARPKALRLMAETEWTYEDYFPETEHRDGGLAHVQERIVTYAAAELGYHVRTVATTDYAAISHTFLEYKLNEVLADVPGYPLEQVHYIRTAMEQFRVQGAGALSYAKTLIATRSPRLARGLKHLYRPARSAYRLGRSAVSNVRGRGGRNALRS